MLPPKRDRKAAVRSMENRFCQRFGAWNYSELKTGRKGDSDRVGPVPRSASISLSFLRSSQDSGLDGGM